MAPNNTFLNSKYFFYLIKQTFMYQCIHSVTLVQICHKQLIFSTAERCINRARTFKIKFKKPYNPRLLAEEKRGSDTNNVSRILGFANSTCSSQNTPFTPHCISVTYVLYSIIAHLRNLGNFGLPVPRRRLYIS